MSWNARVSTNRKTEIRMVEEIEELSIYAKLQSLREGKPLGDVQVAPRESGPPQRISSEIAESTVLGGVSAYTRSRTGVHGRNKSIWIKPLDGTRLRNAWNRVMAV